MARGRRSASVSSVESDDLSNIAWRQETSIVKTGPKDEDPGDYISFEVWDMTVFHTSSPNPADSAQDFPNALEVRIKGPFSARGKLLVEDKSQESRRENARSLLRLHGKLTSTQS